jgi:thymidylate synthase
MGNELDRQYNELFEAIIRFGTDKMDRTGTGTKSVFGYTIRHNMQKGFPILTTKKVAWKQVVSELLWFLTGQTNIEFLHKYNNHIWDGDYKKSGRDDGELGPIYGHQWRNWGGWKEVKFTGEKDENGYLKPTYIKHSGIDQIDDLVKKLKTNPDSRRLMVNAWNVSDLDKMVLPPCHYGFQCWTREQDGKRYLSLMWNQRSVDTFLGLPFNISSYGLLLHILANECGMIPDELIGNLGDTHLYLNHIEQAKEQIGRTPYELPTLKTDAKIDGICCATPDDFVLDGYQYHPTIKAPLSN